MQYRVFNRISAWWKCQFMPSSATVVDDFVAWLLRERSSNVVLVKNVPFFSVWVDIHWGRKCENKQRGGGEAAAWNDDNTGRLLVSVNVAEPQPTGSVIAMRPLDGHKHATTTTSFIRWLTAALIPGEIWLSRCILFLPQFPVIISGTRFLRTTKPQVCMHLESHHVTIACRRGLI